MPNNVFKTIQSSKGLITVQSELCTNGIGYNDNIKSNFVAVVLKSPHASLKRNQQLERDLYRLYRKYYFQVILESGGQFW